LTRRAATRGSPAALGPIGAGVHGLALERLDAGTGAHQIAR